MELNKCSRCGAFFVAGNNVCPNCEVKDSAEIFKLKNFLDENDYSGSSVEELSCNTGISVKNLNRFLEQKDFRGIASKLDVTKNVSGNIEL